MLEPLSIRPNLGVVGRRLPVVLVDSAFSVAVVLANGSVVFVDGLSLLLLCLAKLASSLGWGDLSGHAESSFQTVPRSALPTRHDCSRKEITDERLFDGEG